MKVSNSSKLKEGSRMVVKEIKVDNVEIVKKTS